VEVRRPSDIIATLDGDGTLDGLPFMPEMVPLCGQRFRVAYHVEKTCVDGYRDTFRAFSAGDVVSAAGPKIGTGEKYGFDE